MIRPPSRRLVGHRLRVWSDWHADYETARAEVPFEILVVRKAKVRHALIIADLRRPRSHALSCEAEVGAVWSRAVFEHDNWPSNVERDAGNAS